MVGTEKSLNPNMSSCISKVFRVVGFSFCFVTLGRGGG